MIMKYLLLSLLVLSGVTAMAQAPDLFVRPNPNTGTDSYIYVDDVVLYVEDDVELEKNATGPTEASIYLRGGNDPLYNGDGQLIQGSETAINKGDGLLSVYQNAENSDRWTYNFWGSPVGLPTANGNQNAGVSRIYGVNGGSVTESTQSSTVSGPDGFSDRSVPSGPPLTISRRWIYTHPRGTESEGDYVRINTTNGIAPGMGFIMKGVDNNPNGGNDSSINTGPGYKYDFRGRPNTGEIEVEVFPGEITLVANPYPSALDLNRLFYDTDNDPLISRILFWEESKTKNSHFYAENAGGYGVWVPGASDYNGTTELGTYNLPTFTIWDAAGNSYPDGGVQGTYYERRFAPIGQGFLVEGSTNDFIKIKNEYRRYIKESSSISEFARPAKNTGKFDQEDSNGAVVVVEEDTRLPQLRINTYFDQSHVRQTVLLFSNEATDGFDRGYDGKSPMDATSEAYFPVGQDDNRKPYVINTVPFDASKQIPISFKLDQPYKFWLEAVEEVKMNGKNAYIFDSEENTYQEFTNGKSATYNLPAGTYDNRFYVVFKATKKHLAEATETQNRIEEDVDFFQNNRLGVLEVSNPEGYDIEQALVFDTSGKLVYQKSNIGIEKNFSFPTGNLSDGVYLVKLKTADNIYISYKTPVYNKN